MKKLIATLAIAVGMSGTGLFAQTGDSLEDLSITGTFDYESSYIFRGVRLANDSFQPSVEFGYPVLGGDFYTGMWVNLPITRSGFGGNQGGNTQNVNNEIDIYAGFAYPVTDIVTLDAGFTYYWYPDSPANSNAPGGLATAAYVEPYIGASFDVLLSPAIYIYYALDQLTKPGSSSPDSGILTVEVSIGYSFDLAEYTSLEGASFDVGAYAGVYIPEDSSAFNAQEAFYGGVTADFVYAFSENVSSSIGFRYSNFSQSGVQTGTGGFAANQNNIWVGATLGFTY